MCFTQVIAMAAARVGQSPWTARDAVVPLPEAGRRRQCASHTKYLGDRTRLTQAHTRLEEYTKRKRLDSNAERLGQDSKRSGRPQSRLR